MGNSGGLVARTPGRITMPEERGTRTLSCFHGQVCRVFVVHTGRRPVHDG